MYNPLQTYHAPHAVVTIQTLKRMNMNLIICKIQMCTVGENREALEMFCGQRRFT